MDFHSIYNEMTFREQAREFLGSISHSRTIERARENLLAYAVRRQAAVPDEVTGCASFPIVRDCSRILTGMILPRSDDRAGFSLLQALHDISRGRERGDLSAAFHAEMIHLVRGLEGRAEVDLMSREADTTPLAGREAALVRSAELDRIWDEVQGWMDRWEDGLSPGAVNRRAARRAEVMDAMGVDETRWSDWRWQSSSVVDSTSILRRLPGFPPSELSSVERALDACLPFGITPYYLSLLDSDEPGRRDRSLRAQVLPPRDYVAAMSGMDRRGDEGLDFMRERDTSPVDLVTRRYPAIAILKPFNTCPQICVYCQRNWEIDQAMSPGAMAAAGDLDAAIRWIASHPAVKEVLVTGGDPLAMEDEDLRRLLGSIAAIPHVDLVRIGSRTPVTMPMRFTESLLDILGGLREPGRRDVALVTHVQHPYEVTPELVAAVDSTRRRGIGVYNQMVFTFYNSRRFEAAKLRLLLRRCGIDPYYTFVPKGKEETGSYRVPIARMLQETKEEARLLPGLRRTDASVYNVPGMGKNYLMASHNRDLVSILPDGARLYEFHPWEKNIVRQRSHLGADVPILHYLARLADIGEDISDYESIWYYF